MIFQFNSDNQLSAMTDVAERIETTVRAKLSRIEDQLTRVEVHVGDVNAAKGGADMHATVELRPASLAPVAGTHTAEALDVAVARATDKALTAYDRIIGKRTTRKGH